VLDDSPIAAAIGYAINQQKALERFFDDGRLPMTNNISERNLRKEAVGRKIGSLSVPSVATGHNLIHFQRFHRGPVTRPVVLFDTSPLGSCAASAAVRGAGAARAVPG
jgi:hypothetical protein